MHYIEKEFELIKPADEKTNVINKLPLFIIKYLLKKNVVKIREFMAGDSLDLTNGKIVGQDQYIKGYKEPIRIRLYSPKEKKKRPLMMYYHGGGWIGGSIEVVDEYCKAVAEFSDCVVVSVDYHLAPERPFPEGLEDAYQAILWCIENQGTLNIDPDNIVVSGDSAGGNLSAALTILAKKRHDFTIHKQILIYPVTNLFEPVLSQHKHVNAFNAVMIDLYVQNKADLKNPLVSPILCKSLDQLPQALIAVGDLDVLRDSVLLYGKALDEAGVAVKCLLYKNTQHAFIDNTGNSPQALDLIHEVANFINK